MSKWMLIRHGETEWNATGRIQGHSDVPLNDAGKRQARLLGERLSNIDLAAVYASDSSRALDTTCAVIADRSMDVTVRVELREKSYGEWEGKTGPAIRASHPEEFAIWQNERDPSFAAPGGESELDLRARVCPLIEDLRRLHGDGETIALVAHGGSLRALASELLCIPASAGSMLWLANTGVSTLRVHDRFTTLHRWNDASHWEGGADG